MMVESVKLPFGMEIGEFRPCVIECRELGLTTYIHEDVPYVAKPMTKLHGVDALLAMDDGRLVGVNFWRLLDDEKPVDLRKEEPHDAER